MRTRTERADLRGWPEYHVRFVRPRRRGSDDLDRVIVTDGRPLRPRQPGGDAVILTALGIIALTLLAMLGACWLLLMVLRALGVE